jgi:hypothetical protein
MTDDERFVGSTWSAAGTAVAVIASCVALAFTLFPGLIPDPKAVLAATLTIVRVEPHVTLADYYRRYQPKVPIRKAYDAYPGSIVYLRIKTDGKKHGRVRLRQVTYDARTQNPLPDRDDPVDALGFRPNTPSDQWIAPVWVGDPQVVKQVDYFARLALMDDETILDFVDTPRLHGLP